MRYASTIIYVPDVAAATPFYEQAFGLEVGFAAPGGSYATLAGAGGQLAFASHDQVATSLGDVARAAPAGFEVWIESDDVSAAVDGAVAAGAELVVEPHEMPWGQTIVYVRDPSRMMIEIGEPVSDG